MKSTEVQTLSTLTIVIAKVLILFTISITIQHREYIHEQILRLNIVSL